MYQSSSTENS